MHRSERLCLLALVVSLLFLTAAIADPVPCFVGCQHKNYHYICSSGKVHEMSIPDCTACDNPIATCAGVPAHPGDICGMVDQRLGVRVFSQGAEVCNVCGAVPQPPVVEAYQPNQQYYESFFPTFRKVCLI